jgi:hypothetical protein
MQELVDRLLIPLNGMSPLLKNVSPEVRLLLTLWILGNQESFRGVGDRFGMMKGGSL